MLGSVGACSLFFKSQRAAFGGDLFMSLIHTCQLCGADPSEYLAASTGVKTTEINQFENAPVRAPLWAVRARLYPVWDGR